MPCSLQDYLNLKQMIKSIIGLWQAWHCDHFPGKPVPVTILIKNTFLMSSVNFPWRIFIPFPHVLLLVSREGRTSSIACCEEAVVSDKDNPQPSLLQGEQSDLSCSWKPYPQGLSPPWSPFSGHTLNSLISLCWGTHSCTQDLRWAAPVSWRTEQSPSWVLCLMHPRTRLALLASRACCWLISNLPST